MYLSICLMPLSADNVANSATLFQRYLRHLCAPSKRGCGHLGSRLSQNGPNGRKSVWPAQPRQEALRARNQRGGWLPPCPRRDGFDGALYVAAGGAAPAGRPSASPRPPTSTWGCWWRRSGSRSPERAAPAIAPAFPPAHRQRPGPGGSAGANETGGEAAHDGAQQANAIRHVPSALFMLCSLARVPASRTGLSQHENDASGNRELHEPSLGHEPTEESGISAVFGAAAARRIWSFRDRRELCAGHRRSRPPPPRTTVAATENKRFFEAIRVTLVYFRGT
jgi:hypothetical protein